MNFHELLQHEHKRLQEQKDAAQEQAAQGANETPSTEQSAAPRKRGRPATVKPEG